jgi:hypothetical protein
MTEANHPITDTVPHTLTDTLTTEKPFTVSISSKTPKIHTSEINVIEKLHRRILVIGNSEYTGKDITRLGYASSDVESIFLSLNELGFIGEVYTELDTKSMNQKIKEFID